MLLLNYINEDFYIRSMKITVKTAKHKEIDLTVFLDKVFCNSTAENSPKNIYVSMSLRYMILIENR